MDEELQERMSVEGWQLVQFERLGLGVVEAMLAVEGGIDYHDLETFLKEHPTCATETALRIVG